MSEGIAYAGSVLILASILAMAALILVEAIARKFCDAKKTLVGEYDPERDGDFDYRSMEQ